MVLAFFGEVENSFETARVVGGKGDIDYLCLFVTEEGNGAFGDVH